MGSHGREFIIMVEGYILYGIVLKGVHDKMLLGYVIQHTAV